MITIILSTLFGIGLVWYLVRGWEKNKFDLVYWVGGAGGLVLGVIIAGILLLPLPMVACPDENIELVSLRSSEVASGSFFLGCGSIDEETYYYFYKEYEGGYQLDKIKAKDIVVYEEDREDGELIIKSAWLGDWRWALPFMECSYAFHIPEGSIIREFELR